MSDIITDKYNQQAEAFKAEGGIAGGLKRGLQAITETPERVTYVEETLRASWVQAPSALREDTAPSASLDHLKARQLLRAPERRLSSLETGRDPSSPPRAAPKVEDVPLSTTGAPSRPASSR